VQTCYAKWISICSGRYCEFNALVHVHCVEWNCHYFSVVFLLVPVLLVLSYYMVNKDEYNSGPPSIPDHTKSLLAARRGFSDVFVVTPD